MVSFASNPKPADTHKTQATSLSDSDIEKIKAVVDIVHRDYVKSVTNQELVDAALDGMLNNLDPHSSYLTNEDLKSLKIITSSEFEGIGVSVIPFSQGLKVVSVLDGSPAQKAGLENDDVIIKVDNKLIIDMPSDSAINLLRGPKNSKVTLAVLRKNRPAPLTFKITRAVINVKTVKSSLIDNNYGYLRISVFYKDTAAEVKQAVADLFKKAKDHKLFGLVIDLRNNPGGLFDPAVKVSNYLLDANHLRDNKLIVYISNPLTKHREDYFADGKAIIPGTTHIVVLINDGTASAAEILTGALQDHKRALVIGTQSFGKGSVQSIISVNGSAVKLTTALYYTPLGNIIQAQGITPDILLKDFHIEKASLHPSMEINESQLENYIEVAHNTKTEPQEIKTKELQLLQNDFQLYEAITVLKACNLTTKPNEDNTNNKLQRSQ
jgi:carboxyl-terminal processing protease